MTNTVIEPGAMMIIDVNAFITRHAMFCRLMYVGIAELTLEFVILHFHKRFLLSLKSYLKNYDRVLWIYVRCTETVDKCEHKCYYPYNA